MCALYSTPPLAAATPSLRKDLAVLPYRRQVEEATISYCNNKQTATSHTVYQIQMLNFIQKSSTNNNIQRILKY
uniref:Uncharacterized protein n=1 Tax=Octopus bimaculoides TaxID=37653 RepID=A0A0L8HPP3_OCTBM